MINELVMTGSIDTTYHTLNISTNGMDLVISAGEYYRNSQLIWSDVDGGTITIPASAKSYQLYLMTNNEISLYQYDTPEEFSQFYNDNRDSIIDRIAWFDVPNDVTSLDNVEINFVKINLE